MRLVAVAAARVRCIRLTFIKHQYPAHPSTSCCGVRSYDSVLVAPHSQDAATGGIGYSFVLEYFSAPPAGFCGVGCLLRVLSSSGG